MGEKEEEKKRKRREYMRKYTKGEKWKKYQSKYNKLHRVYSIIWQKQKSSPWYRNRQKSPKRKYYNYKLSAKARELVWGLSMEQFMQFWQKPCYYCGAAIETIGLDRVDNTRGYIEDNVRACCIHCNRAKMAYTEEEFISHCKLVASRF